MEHKKLKYKKIQVVMPFDYFLKYQFIGLNIYSTGTTYLTHKL